MSDYHFTCTKNHICCSGLSLNAENEPVRTRPDVWGWQIFSVRRRHTEYLSIPLCPLCPLPLLILLPCDCHLHQLQPFALLRLNLMSACLCRPPPFFSLPLLSLYSCSIGSILRWCPLHLCLHVWGLLLLRQFYYSMWWCSLHWQISGDGSLEGNDDTVRQPLSSTACNHLLKDSTSCDMQ